MRSRGSTPPAEPRARRLGATRKGYDGGVDAPLATGKLPPELLAELLDDAPTLPPEVRLGPRPGEDAAAIDVDAGTLVVATDPITLTGSDVGAHAVVINANDVAVMGVAPRWFLAAVLLPEGTGASDVRALFRGMRAALAPLGVALVGGHTEITAAVTQSVVVGQMLGLAERGRVIRTGGLRAGDSVLQVGPAPVEGAAVLASEWRAPLHEVRAADLAAARDALQSPGISVVRAALLAAEHGATALHDPTEGGLATGLHELASTSGLRITLAPEAVLWFAPGLALCHAIGADPWGTLASGALLVGVPESAHETLLDLLRGEGLPAACIGRATEGPAGVVPPDGTPLATFARDELARVL